MSDLRQRHAVVGLMPTRSMKVSNAIGGIASVGRLLLENVFIRPNAEMEEQWQALSVSQVQRRRRKNIYISAVPGYRERVVHEPNRICGG